MPTWFALDHDAASPAAMEAGVRDADVFVLFATDGCFTPNVRHEVACAVDMKKPLIVLRDADGPPLDAVLEQACALLDRRVVLHSSEGLDWDAAPADVATDPRKALMRSGSVTREGRARMRTALLCRTR